MELKATRLDVDGPLATVWLHRPHRHNAWTGRRRQRRCAGVAFALALFCDLRFVSATARITTAVPKLGLPAEYGTSWALPRLSA